MSDEAKTPWTDAIWAGPAILSGFCLATALILSGTDLLTRTPIAERMAEDLEASLRQVLPGLSGTPPQIDIGDELEGTVTVFRTYDEDGVTRAAFELTGYGYSGAIRVLIAVGRSGEVQGVRVLSHSETPGLGDKIEIAKDPWVDGFRGRSLSNPAPEGWKVQKDGGVFDQFSGATMTPRAVVATVYRGLSFADRHHDRIFSEEGAE